MIAAAVIIINYQLMKVRFFGDFFCNFCILSFLLSYEFDSFSGLFLSSTLAKFYTLVIFWNLRDSYGFYIFFVPLRPWSSQINILK